MKYIEKSDLKNWNETEKYTIEQLIHLLKVEGDVDCSVECQMIFNRLKQKLNMSFKIPESYTKKEWNSFGYNKNELLPVPHSSLKVEQK